MRRILFLLILICALPAGAQTPPPPPPKMEPLPEPPPPAVALDDDQLQERGVRIQKGEKAEELTFNGKRVIRVTRPSGKVYYLIEHQPGMEGPPRHDASDSGVRAAQWVIHQW